MEKYQIIKNLFTTHFSVIYKATNIDNNETIILKKSKSRDDYNIVKNLQHPGIIRYFDSFIDNSYIYIAMKMYVSDLFEILCDKNILTYSLSSIYFSQVLSAVEYLHNNNILHNDIKPENILINDKECVLSDFGMSYMVEDKYQDQFNLVGTYEYASPELLYNEGFNYKNDIYSLGLVLCEMMIHNNFFNLHENHSQGAIYNLAYEKSKILNLANLKLDKDLKNLILQMTYPDKLERIEISHIKNHSWFLTNSSSFTNNLTL